MKSITTAAEAFFDACETGKGWEACSVYCSPNATFSAQAEPLLAVKTLAQYTDWMRGMITVLPDARYEVKSFATDVPAIRFIKKRRFKRYRHLLELLLKPVFLMATASMWRELVILKMKAGTYQPGIGTN